MAGDTLVYGQTAGEYPIHKVFDQILKLVNLNGYLILLKTTQTHGAETQVNTVVVDRGCQVHTTHLQILTSLVLQILLQTMIGVQCQMLQLMELDQVTTLYFFSNCYGPNTGKLNVSQKFLMMTGTLTVLWVNSGY